MSTNDVIRRAVVDTEAANIPTLELTPSYEKEPIGISSAIDEKLSYKKDIESQSASDDESEEAEVIHDARELVTHVISVEDDPSLNPWTFRSFFIGLGLSTFGGVLGEYELI